MKLDHIAIKVSDVEEATKWYCNKLNVNVIYETDSYKQLQLENTILSIIDENRYEHAHIGIFVDKIEDFPEDGVIIEHRDGSTGCYTMDPSGNCVEFIFYGPNSSKNP